MKVIKSRLSTLHNSTNIDEISFRHLCVVTFSVAHGQLWRSSDDDIVAIILYSINVMFSLSLGWWNVPIKANEAKRVENNNNDTVMSSQV